MTGTRGAKALLSRECRGRLGAHLRWLGWSWSLGATLLTVLFLAHAAIRLPEALLQQTGPELISTITGVAGASATLCGAVSVGAFVLSLMWLWLHPMSRSAGLPAYATAAFGAPAGLVAAAWCQFVWLQGRLDWLSLSAVLAALLVGLTTGYVLGRFLAGRPNAASEPSRTWFLAAAALTTLNFAPTPTTPQPHHRRVDLEADCTTANVGGASGFVPVGTRASTTSGLALAEAKTAARRDTIVLLTIDTLRADHMSSYGYGRKTTPHIDTLFADGVRAEKMYAAASATVPATAAIVTGLEPWCTGVLDQRSRVPDDVNTLAERLQKAGYRTIGVTANLLLTAKRGFSQGFDRFANVFHRPHAKAEEVTQRAIELIGDEKGPLFVWIHYMDPHYPYTPPEGLYGEFLTDALYTQERLPVIRFSSRGGAHVRRLFDTEPRASSVEIGYIIARYDGEIRQMDAGVAQFIDWVLENRTPAGSAILLSADHGEGLAEHEAMFQHGLDTYDSTIRVPALLWAPGMVAPSTKIRGPTTQLDIAPTLLGLAGLSSEASGLPGRSLLQVDRRWGNRPLVSQSGWWDGVSGALVSFDKLSPVRAIIQDGWKFVEHRYDELPQTRGPSALLHAWHALLGRVWLGDALYHMKADPNEQDNLLATQPERGDQMREALASYPTPADFARCGQTARAQPLEEDSEALMEQLRALGYVE